jgi:hypothetical protein
MTSLHNFSKAIFEASKPRLVDIEMAFNIGENYANNLCKFINKWWEIIEFNCVDNGVEKSFLGSSLCGEVKIIILLDPIHRNKLIIESQNYPPIEYTYSTYDDFIKMLDLIDRQFSTNNETRNFIQCD